MIYTQVIGRLGADSELRTSKNGNQFVSMRVASNDFVNGENVTTWLNVIWSGERAVKMQEHMKKGSLVSIYGTLRTSLFTNKNGEQAISTDVFADRIDFVSGGNSGATPTSDAVADTTTTPAQKQKEEPQAEAMAKVAASSASSDDDLPF